MPPKTKQQIRAEEKAKAEEERKIKEEEERIALEKEQERRDEEIRLLKLEQERIEREELKRLSEEAQDVQNWREAIRGKAMQMEKKLKEDLEWEKYISQDFMVDTVDRPDINQEQQLTSFISKYKENLKKSNIEYNQFLNEIQFAEEVVQELFFKQMLAVADKVSFTKQWCQQYIDAIREISGQMLTKITAQLVIDSDQLLEEKDEEQKKRLLENPGLKKSKDESKKNAEDTIMKEYGNNTFVKYGIQINPQAVSGYANFRQKPIDFQKLQVQCGVPRHLGNQQLIMSVNWTSYDCVSKVFDVDEEQNKETENKEVEVEVEKKEEEVEKKEEEGEKKEEEKKEEEVKKEEEGEKKEEEGEKKEDEEEKKEEKEEEKEVEKTTSKFNSMKSSMRKELVVGGVLEIILIDFLPGPKKTSEWQLKKKFSEEEAIVKQHFPPLDTNGQMNWQNLTEVKVQYALPSTVFIHHDDDKQVAYWDGECWNNDTIEDIKLEIDKTNQKLLSFTTKRLAPFAYVQPRTIDFPYKKFQIRCVSNQKCFIDINTKRVNLQFELGVSNENQKCYPYAMMVPSQEVDLPEIQDKKMSPGALLILLQQAGINLLPNEDDTTLAKIWKTEGVEDKAIEDLSLGCRSFFIRSSRWSNSLESDQIMVKLRENMDFDQEFAEDQEKDWKSVIFYSNKVECVKARDSANKCNREMMNQSNSHSTLQMLFANYDLTTEEALDNLKREEFILFTEQVRRFLKLTRLFAFTTHADEQ